MEVPPAGSQLGEEAVRSVAESHTRVTDDARPTNWGVFGPSDELGTLNYLTPEAVLRGVGSVRSGERFPLNLPLNVPSVGEDAIPAIKRDLPGYRRTSHRINLFSRHGLITNDDHVSFATQSSSQWDALIHVGIHEDNVDGVFYNGVGLSAVGDDGYAHRNGIDNMARVGIVGRGVLLDIARMEAGGGSRALPAEYRCTPEDTLRCIADQGVEILPGDIVCFRTGWAETYLDADEDVRLNTMAAAADGAFRTTAGITSDHAQLAHAQRWAAVTADNPGIEALPLGAPEDSAHVRMLRNLGLAFGELLDFRALSAACAEDRRWEFLFVAVPLWIPGGAGSPANAIAIR